MLAFVFASVFAAYRPPKPPPMITIRLVAIGNLFHAETRRARSSLTRRNKLLPKQRESSNGAIRAKPELHRLVNILGRIDCAEGVVVFVDEWEREPLPVQRQRVV